MLSPKSYFSLGWASQTPLGRPHLECVLGPEGNVQESLGLGAVDNERAINNLGSLSLALNAYSTDAVTDCPVMVQIEFIKEERLF